VGDVFMAVGETSYNGPFTGYYRRECIESWLAQVREKNIPISESYSLVKCLGRPMEIRDWQIKGLPSDTVSIENSIIATQSLKFPLLIDPQLQALRWLKNAFEESRLRCVRLEGGSFLAEVRGAVKNGKTVVVEDVELVLPAILEQVLGREVMQLDGVDVVKFGDDFINFDREFQIFFCTKLPNPQFLPEVFNKVNVINFTATEQGLEEQLLALVVANEREEVERQRDENIVKMAGYRKLIVESEQNILRLLERTDSSKILDDL
jgi:dynein heavy chain, axonemal